MIDKILLPILLDIQKAYSKLLNLNVLVIDETGKKIMPAEIFPEVGPLLNQHMQIDPDYLDTILTHSKEETAFFYDIAVNGVKILVSTIRNPYSSERYFVLGGFIVEKGTETATIHNIENSSLSLDLKDRMIGYIKKYDSLSLIEINKKLSIISEYARIINFLLSLQAGKDQINKNLFHSLQHGFSSQILPINNLLKDFKEQTDVIDLVCYASKISEEDYVVTHASGKYANEILGLTFKNGEGFMGIAGISKEAQTWTNLERDPRTTIFTELGMDMPEEVWCNAIKPQQDTVGIVCIINFAKQLHDTISDSIREIVASMLTSKITAAIINENFMSQKQRLAGLVEVSNFLRSSTDIQSVLYSLVDISLTLVTKPKSAIVFFSNDLDRKKVKIVSRGKSPTETESYVKEASKRYFRQGLKNSVSSSASLTNINNVYLYEYPIVFNKEIYGVLAVEMNSSSDMEESSQLLSTLVIMVSMILNNREEFAQAQGVADETANMLFSSLEYHKPEVFIMTTELNKVIGEFIVAHPTLDIQPDLLKRSSLLSSFDPELLRKSSSLQREAGVVEQYKRLTSATVFNEKDLFSKEAQLLFLADYHVTNKLGNPTVPYLNEELVVLFHQHLENRNVLDMEISLEEKEEITPSETTGSILEKITKEYGLTPREKDVFQAILQASSNKEIAKTLYISEHTVKNHVTNLFNKLGVTDRTQAISLVLNKTL